VWRDGNVSVLPVISLLIKTWHEPRLCGFRSASPCAHHLDRKSNKAQVRLGS
jgi:hypothetical protein